MITGSSLLGIILGAIARFVLDWFKDRAAEQRLKDLGAAEATAEQLKEQQRVEARMREANARPATPDGTVVSLRDGNF